jgi:hypothetical protein
MRSHALFAVALVSTALACAPPNYWKEPVGVSDKAEVASDQSLDMDGGGNNSACARSPELLEGKPCAPEGAICGKQNPDPHQFSNSLVCRDGAWDRQESPPMTSPSAKPAKP